MYALMVYGFGFEINPNDRDQSSSVITADLASALATTIPLALTALAINLNATKPNWAWTAALIPSTALLACITSNYLRQDEEKKALAAFLSTTVTAGVGIGLAPPASKVLSTKLRIGLVGSVLPLIAIAAAAYLYLAQKKKEEGIDR